MSFVFAKGRHKVKVLKSRKEKTKMENLDKVYAEKIAEEYAPKKTSKVLQLKKLDAKVKRPAEILAYSLGIIAALILGVGMCLTMGVLGDKSTVYMAIGIVVGILGIALICINYPLYKKFLNARKAKFAFEITELAKAITEE